MKIEDEAKYKSILVEILTEFDRVCNTHDLRYFLTGGSMIGAIRHQGIIPWDDDIDVAMPRADLEKLKVIAKDVFHSNVELVTNKVEKGYYQRFAKLYHKETTLVEQVYPFFIGGVYIDVFALDGLPNDKKEKEEFLQKYERCYYKLHDLYSKPQGFFKKNPIDIYRNLRKRIYHKIYTIDNLIDRCEGIATRYPFDEAEEIINFQGGYGRKEISKRCYFDDHLLVPFEGKQFRIPKGYNEYLTGVYGNYMQLPPLEKRKTNHSHYFLNLERSCTKEDIEKIIIDNHS